MVSRRNPAAGNVSSGSDPGRSPTGGSAMQSASAKWSPTVANLMVILVVEIVAFAVIRFAFSRVA